MSTRAIIGILKEDGTVKAGWQWNDGMQLLPVLNKHFNNLEKANSLICNGVWNSMIEATDTGLLEDFTKWTKRENSQYHLVSVEDCYLLKEKPCDNAEYCFGGDEGITINEDGSMTFDSVSWALEQDISYLYLLNKDNKTWKCLLHEVLKPKKESITEISMKEFYNLICHDCGNIADWDGFTALDNDLNEIDISENEDEWTGYIKCLACGKTYKVNLEEYLKGEKTE